MTNDARRTREVQVTIFNKNKNIFTSKLEHKEETGGVLQFKRGLVWY